MSLKAGQQAQSIEFEATRYKDGSARVRARVNLDGPFGRVLEVLVDSTTLADLIATLQGVRDAVRIPVDPQAPTPSWEYGPAPRGVRLLVTTRAPEGGLSRIYVATLSHDHDDNRWFSEGRRIHGVIAWMFLPPAAEEPQ